MAYRAAWLVVVLAVAGGCDRLSYSDHCDQDASATCCPDGSHPVSHLIDPMNELVICAPDENLDAGASGSCDDAGTDAH
jgi:hypothetical protein